MQKYLKQVYEKLDKLKKDYLKDVTPKQSKDDLKKQLVNIACWLERTRLYLDNYIYPMDFSLNLIDVQIEERTEKDRK